MSLLPKRGPGRPRKDQTLPPNDAAPPVFDTEGNIIESAMVDEEPNQGDSIEEAQAGSAVTFSEEQFARLLAAMQSSQASATSPALELAIKAVTGLQEEVKRTVRRSNATHPGISVFSYPEGDEAARQAGKFKQLKYETYFCYQREREDSLTPLEVDLYNRFETSRSCRDGRWNATLQKNGTKTTLHVVIPCKTNDDLASMPPLTAILGELLYGAEVVDPNTAMAKIVAMQKEIDALNAQAVGA